jgi:hypothetical protein
MLGIGAFALLAAATVALVVRLLLAWGASAPLWDLFLLMVWIGSLMRVCTIISENSTGKRG